MSKIWLKRTEDWIRTNPGKGTMYKGEITDKVTEDEISVLVSQRRKSVKREQIDIRTDQGIYIIVCEAEKHVYVGQSINMGTRLRSHKLCLSENNNNTIKTYVKMREHRKKHGIAAIEFKRYIKIDNSEELMDMENKTMYEYMARGYTLYNTTIPGNLYCSEELRPLMIKIIEAARDEAFADKLRELLE